MQTGLLMINLSTRYDARYLHNRLYSNIPVKKLRQYYRLGLCAAIAIDVRHLYKFPIYRSYLLTSS
jgi:hypothetical protein